MRTPGKMPGARDRFNGASLAGEHSESTPASRTFQALPVGPGERAKRSSTVPTADHDEGLSPLYGAPLGVLVPILLDRRWVVVPPGDPVAQHLIGIEAGGGI